MSRPGQLRRLTTDSRAIAHESRTGDPVSSTFGVASGHGQATEPRGEPEGVLRGLSAPDLPRSG